MPTNAAKTKSSDTKQPDAKPMRRKPARRKAAKRSPSDIARDTFRILFEERDLSKADELWSDSSTDHFLAAGQTVVGKDALAQWFRELLDAVPDWTMEIENTFDDGDRQAIVQWRGGGTFSGGPFLGIEPTGRRIEMRGVDVFRFDENGRVDTNTVYYDGAEFARQVGMLPERDSAADRAVLSAFNARTRVVQRVKSRRAARRA